MATGQVSQMFEQALDAPKGWFYLSALDKSAPLEPALLAGATAVPAGRCASLNSLGEFVLGLDVNQAMPIFLWNGKDHPDVSNSGVSPTTSITHWVAISPTGVMSGLVATGGYELQTTEFDTAQTYAPNDALTPAATGILTNQAITLYTTPVVGVCSWHNNEDNEPVTPASSPVGTNAHGVTTLSFWPVYLPGPNA
jgi:hypothetical protein